MEGLHQWRLHPSPFLVFFFLQVFTCVGVRLSTCLGEMGYMLCSTGVPVPYRLGESVGRVPEETVL